MGAPLPPPAPRPTAALLFNVSTLLHESVGSARHYTRMNAQVLLERQWTPISGSVELLLTGRSILATAAFTVTVAETCGACLATYALDLPVAFAEDFWPPTPAIRRERREIPEGREGFSIVDGLLDLSEAVAPACVAGATHAAALWTALPGARPSAAPAAGGRGDGNS